MTDPSPARARANAASLFTASLAEADPEIADAVGRELGRQRDEIELIASENIVSRAVLEAQGSVLTNKYAYVLVSTDPCASSTALLTMFSEAISSISSRWRPNSRPTASAISGSASASEAVNRLAALARARAGDGSVIDLTLILEAALRAGGLAGR